MADAPTPEATLAASVAAAAAQNEASVLQQQDVTGTPIAQVVQRVIDDPNTPPGE